MTGNRKIELNMDRAGLSGWLMDLATGFDKGEFLLEEAPIALERFKSLKLSFKQNADGTLGVKLSVKYPKSTCADGTTPNDVEEQDDASGMSLPKYKSLKKHMKQTFKSIGLALSAGQLPPDLEARSFVADSRLMLEYQGKGDEFYDAYREGTLGFEAALAAADLDALRAAYQSLAQIKRDCHSRHA